MAEEVKETKEVKEAPAEKVWQDAKPVKDPTKDLKKEIKELKDALAKANAVNEQYQNMLQAYKTQLDAAQNTINGLAKKYSEITEYIKKSTDVYATGLYMVLEEGQKYGY